MAIFKTYTFYIILTLAASLAMVGWLYKNKLEDYAVKEQEVVALTASLTELNNQITSERLKHETLAGVKATVQGEFRKSKSILDGMKNRQDVVKKKPGLVERKIQTSFDLYMKDLQCQTGAKESC